jgi:hypothetical protein
MKFKLGLLCLAIATTVWAYNPKPVVRSAAEQQITAALAKAESDSAKIQVASDALTGSGEDIAAARVAQDVLLKFKDDPAAWFKARAEGSKSIAAHYLYARASDDSTIMAEQAAWILKQDPKNFWGLMMAGEAEWNKSAPDLKQVQKSFEDAVAADPSRPEGYLYLGYLFIDQDQWKNARLALDAGAICDPSSQPIREQRLTTFAELRDASAYFDLAKASFSDRPLQMDLPRANADGQVTAAMFKDTTTVIEYWAYT